ncbi:hypothetical protein [Geoalkalibacter sp.]|uniref:hypothetical protein n=1 Tax=Geoalkalibacter sp. TaxID=3041440 RepID=UPI00272E9AEF|nr:hypothetical protein [Geoalkalibacter sp.]
MVPLRIDSGSAQSLYLDIHHVHFAPSCGTGHLVISAILGDGCYEGEIAVELGSRIGVTFADQYLAERRIAAFFARVDRDRLEAAILDAVGTLIFSVGRPGTRQKVLAYRHGTRVLSLPGAIRPRRVAPRTGSRRQAVNA